MEYKIFEENTTENENVDGAGFNNFCSSGRDVIIQGILNDCRVLATGVNVVTIKTGELLIQGFRIKLLEPFVYTFSALPSIPIKYEIVGKLQLYENRDVTFEFIVRVPQKLTQDELFKEEKGVYEVQIATFTHEPKNGIREVAECISIAKGSAPLVPNRPIYVNLPYDTIRTHIETFTTNEQWLEQGDYYAFWYDDFNRPAIVGDKFGAICSSLDGYVFNISAEVTRFIQNGRVNFKILDEHTYGIDDFVLLHDPTTTLFKGTSAPTTETVGKVGQLYSDITNGNLYQLKLVYNGKYFWETIPYEEDIYERLKEFEYKVEVDYQDVNSVEIGTSLIPTSFYVPAPFNKQIKYLNKVTIGEGKPLEIERIVDYQDGSFSEIILKDYSEIIAKYGNDYFEGVYKTAYYLTSNSGSGKIYFIGFDFAKNYNEQTGSIKDKFDKIETSIPLIVHNFISFEKDCYDIHLKEDGTILHYGDIDYKNYGIIGKGNKVKDNIDNIAFNRNPKINDKFIAYGYDTRRTFAINCIIESLEESEVIYKVQDFLLLDNNALNGEIGNQINDIINKQNALMGIYGVQLDKTKLDEIIEFQNSIIGGIE